MNQAFIALGTNIEPREEHLTQALDLLETNEYISIQKNLRYMKLLRLDTRTRQIF